MSSVETRSICFSDFVFDRDSRELRKADYPVRLHPQPAQVLGVMLSRPGEMITRHELRKELWDGDAHVDFDQSINSCIRQIRAALHDDADQPRFIQTIPRKGYRFIYPVERDREKKGGSLSSHSIWLRLAAAVSFATLLPLGLWLVLRSPQETPKQTSGEDPISIAVLPFDNLSADPSLEWLRLGLADMLITDLAQSPRLDILPTNRLYQLIRNDGYEQSPATAVAQEIAQKAGVQAVLLGSFAESGESLRINVRLQDAVSGEILWSDKANGVMEESIFPTVDLLAGQIRERFPSADSNQPELDMHIENVTTASLEAYRYYMEGIKFHIQIKEQEAIVLLEKAIAIDPEFAMALIKLSTIHNNRGHSKVARDLAARAVEQADRLPPQERYYVEGRFYSLREETVDRAIEAFTTNVELFPNQTAPRHNLANRYRQMERYDEAIEQWEELKRMRHTVPMVYGLCAFAYDARGDEAKAHQFIVDYVTWKSKSPGGWGHLGAHYLRWGKLDEAMAALLRAEELPPHGSQGFRIWHVWVLRENWEQAHETAIKLGNSTNPTSRSLSSSLQAVALLYKGLSGEAIALLDEASRAYPGPTINRCMGHNIAASILLERNEAAEALAHTEISREDGRGDVGEWHGLFYASLAQSALGRDEEALATAEAFSEKAKRLPSQKENRRYQHLVGLLELGQVHLPTALEHLHKAQSMLPARGFVYSSGWVEPPPHVAIWYALGTAYLETGNDDKAFEWFRRVADSGSEHIWWPIPFVRSFYFLGKIHEQRGDMEQAHEYYRRFYEYWKDGEMDGDRVEEARRFLDSI